MKNPALAISLFVFSAAVSAMGQTAPALRLTDGINTVTIDANGSVTYSPGCACTTASSSGTAGNPERVSWKGTIGGFTVSTAQGDAQSSASASPDLSLVAFYGGAGGATLTVSWTSIGYTGPITVEGLAQTNFSPGGSAVYSYYIDNSNAVFGTGSLVGTLTATGSIQVAGPVWPTLATGTYSVTEVEAITLPGGASFNGDNEMVIAAQPMTISCAVSSGVMGLSYSSSLGVTGGTAPYTFQIVSGALPTGLSLNASTGLISGTPQVSGNFSYTILITDAAGIPAESSCGIAISGGGSPITLACPASSGTVGAAYSSSLIATGGVPPYMFSVSAGTLPPGLSLNAATGAITGAPSSEGPFSFTARAVDSSGNAATDSVTSMCGVTVATCGTSLTPVTYNVNEKNTIGEIAWFNSHLAKLSGTIPTSTFQIFVTGGKITFGPYTLPVPDAVITFSSTVTCAKTMFNAGRNRWETNLPLSDASKADEIFAAGLAYLIPSGFPQNVNNVTWSADITSTAPGLKVTWQYGVSNWLTASKGTSFPALSSSPFTPDYNGMSVNPGHNATECANYGGDHAGAPEFTGRGNVLTGGGSGGGGSNWTGSWSSTPSGVNVCKP